METIELLRNLYNDPFEISTEQWHNMLPYVSRREYKKNELLIQSGEHPRYVYLLVHGVARNYIIDKKGNEFTKAFKGPAQLIAPYAELILKLPCKTNIQAIQPTEVIRVDFNGFRQLSQRYTCWLQVEKKIAEENFLVKEKRENEFLQLSAEQRYMEFLNDHPEIHKRIPQYMIASYIGVTPVFLSRMLKNLNSA